MHRVFNSVPGHGNVVFNFSSEPIEDLTAFALGYREAAHTLATNITENSGYADYDGYPILFLYRHSLELYLKAIVYRGMMIEGLISLKTVDTKRLFERHDLVKLAPAVQAIFKQMSWNFEGSGFQAYDDFASFMATLDSIDPGSFAFRYPITRSGEASLPRHFVVNVPEFSRVLYKLLLFLEGAACGLDEQWGAEAEALFELQQLAYEQ